jgi:hypothetical protein
VLLVVVSQMTEMHGFKIARDREAEGDKPGEVANDAEGGSWGEAEKSIPDEEGGNGKGKRFCPPFC